MKNRTVITIITLLVLLLATSFFYNRKFFILVMEQNNEIIWKTMKIESLEKICRWEKVLEQILPPVSQDELNLMEEYIKQKKESAN